MYHLPLLTCLLLVVAGSVDSSNTGDGNVAVCISGHARSLVERRVYEGIKHNLVDPLGGTGGADVFMYLELSESRTEESRNRINAGWDSGPTSYNATEESLEEALAILQPVAIRYHERSLTRWTSFSCAYPSNHSRPQLEKMNSCFQLVLDHEVSRGWAYKWVARSRPDLGWLWPVPPADSFLDQYVYVSSNYWPMGDQVSQPCGLSCRNVSASC
jgi:hypothetical protein